MELGWIPLAVLSLGFAGLVGSGLVLWFKRKKIPAKAKTEVGPLREEPRSHLFSALRRTRERLREIWLGGDSDDDAFGLLEEALVSADVGAETASQLVKRLRSSELGARGARTLGRRLAEELIRVLEQNRRPSWNFTRTDKPKAVVMVGVNGVGKTTSVAKLAWWLRSHGHRVLLVAADTFRAAAGEQLEAWAERLGISCVRHQAGADPAAVVFDGLQAAQSRQMDVVIVDTAGRLHSKQHLVEELRKIVRTAQKQLGEDNVEVFLVIDATNGQNAVVQAQVLSQAVGVTGVCLTKLDGTAKGGVVIPIAIKFGLPIRFVGFGEGLQDWEEFDPRAFVSALLGEELDPKAERVVPAELGHSEAAAFPT